VGTYKGFSILGKIGLVWYVFTGFAVFHCWHWLVVKLAYAVPCDADALCLLAINALHLVNADFLNKLLDTLGYELFDIRVLTHKDEEAVNIHGVFLFTCYEPFQLG